MNLKKSSCVAVFLAVFFAFSISAFAQVMQRPRIVQPTGSYPIPNQTSQISPSPTTKTLSTSRPILTNDLRVSDSYNNPASLVKKTSFSAPTNSTAAANYAMSSPMTIFNSRLAQVMDSKLGIPYRYGATGNSSIDCSGLVWMVFQEAGLNFERTSALNYWREFEPVSGNDRYKFGTLVFFNDLGHVGIVVNDKGFYHASSSKGVTYSSFDGYWEKRIVGYRRIPMTAN